jgi:hypothetical protein
MKKSTILVIGLISLLAIVFVAFFGVVAEGIQPTVYITSVEIRDPKSNPYTEFDKDEKVLTLKYKPNIYDPNDGKTPAMSYYFSTYVLPLDATNSSAYIYSCDDNDYVSFLDRNAGQLIIRDMEDKTVPYQIVTVTCSANDGGPSGIKDTLRITVDYSGK